MAKGGVTRRLAAIVAADVAGYSRLTVTNEEGTLTALRAHRTELIDPTIAKHRGRIANTAGDSILIEFSSVVEAVRCATDVQLGLADRNRGTPVDQRIEYRIGINVGDVVDNDGDLLGDGVNVAARLESLAEPGGICFSQNVYDQIRDKLDIDIDDLGEFNMKNIARPVHVYRTLAGSQHEHRPKLQRGFARRYFLAIALVATLCSTVALLLWQPWSPATDSPSTSNMDELPAIAVLPFENLSGDPEQEYFADGITDDLITDLSHLSGLLVIARNSVFTYKGRTISVQQVGKELGVQYVLEGSIRRSDERVRINAQLVETANAHHLWAERFDQNVTDVFALQDEVTRKIVNALSVELTASDRESLSRRAETNPDAYDLLLRGLERYRRFTPEGNVEARRFFERAIALDPGYARAHADIAVSHLLDITLGWTDNHEMSLHEAASHAEHAFALDPKVREVYFALASVHLRSGRNDEAIEAGRTAIKLDPNYADAHAQLAWNLTYSGQADAALDLIRKAMRLNPHYSYFFEAILGHTYFHLERYDDAVEILERTVERNPQFLLARQYLAATYGRMGRIEDAEWAGVEVLALNPDFSISAERKAAPYRSAGDLEFYLEGLRLAGLPM